jgi:hypothetical protein
LSNPKGFDSPELLKQMLLKYALEKAQNQIAARSRGAKIEAAPPES